MKDGPAVTTCVAVVLAVCAGHALCATEQGTIEVWGRVGQSNHVPPPNLDFVVIVSGQHHNIGLRSDGSVAAWGAGERGGATACGTGSRRENA